MGTIKAVREKYAQAYSAIGSTLAETVSRTSDIILDLNKDQLLYGRNSKGEELTPDYLSDPYFETPAAAHTYAAMKYRLENLHKGRMHYIGVQLFPDKKKNTPNLLVSGNWFFNHMFISVSKDSFTIGSTGQAAPDIEQKYGAKIYGLAPQSIQFYYFGWIRPALLALYKK